MELFTLLGMAALGGLMLNIMPCVLPVIALKVLNFIKLGGESKREALFHGLLYGGGIIASFLLLGGVAWLIKALGGAVIFGYQVLTSVAFNFCVGALLSIMGIKLLGGWRWVTQTYQRLRGRTTTAFRTTFSGRLGEWVYKIKARAPYLGTFFNGICTTAIGSACCGPFLASAMGAALVLNPVVIVATFLAAGLGMALPYILLSIAPSYIKWLPKCGKWVKIVEIVCGVIILITAGWFIHLAIG